MKTYNLSDFGGITSAKELVSNAVLLKELPDIEDVKKLATWTSGMSELFERTPSYFDGSQGVKQDRSGALARMAYEGAEQGWTDEQIMAALLDADSRWGKYVARRDRDKRLLDFINRARQKHGYMPVTDLDLTHMLKSSKESASINTDDKLVYGFQDFVDADFKIDWMLDGLLAVEGFGLVTGLPGVGKTQFAIQLGAHLALGHESFLQWDNIGGSKKVMFLSMEMGAAPLNLFLSQIANNYEDRHKLNANFLVVPIGTPIPFDTPPGQSFLNNLLDEFMPDLIIVDSLQAAISKEITDELAVKALLEYLSRVRKRTNASVVMIHHHRKESSDQVNSTAKLSDVYGSVYLSAGVDFVIALKALNPSMLSVSMLKNRLGVSREPFEIVRDPNTLSFSAEFEHLQDQFDHRASYSGFNAQNETLTL